MYCNNKTYPHMHCTVQTQTLFVYLGQDVIKPLNPKLVRNFRFLILSTVRLREVFLDPADPK